MDKIRGAFYVRMDATVEIPKEIGEGNTYYPVIYQNGRSLIEEYVLRIPEDLEAGDHIYIYYTYQDAKPMSLTGVVASVSHNADATYLHLEGLYLGNPMALYWGSLPGVGGFGVDDMDHAIVHHSDVLTEEMSYREYHAVRRILYTFTTLPRKRFDVSSKEEQQAEFRWAAGVLQDWRDRFDNEESGSLQDLLAEEGDDEA